MVCAYWFVQEAIIGRIKIKHYFLILILLSLAGCGGGPNSPYPTPSAAPSNPAQYGAKKVLGSYIDNLGSQSIYSSIGNHIRGRFDSTMRLIYGDDTLNVPFNIVDYGCDFEGASASAPAAINTLCPSSSPGTYLVGASGAYATPTFAAPALSSFTYLNSYDEVAAGAHTVYVYGTVASGVPAASGVLEVTSSSNYSNWIPAAPVISGALAISATPATSTITDMAVMKDATGNSGTANTYVLSISTTDVTGASTIYFSRNSTPTSFATVAGSYKDSSGLTGSPWLMSTPGKYYLFYSTRSNGLISTLAVTSTDLVTWTPSKVYPTYAPFVPIGNEYAGVYNELGVNAGVTAVEYNGKTYFIYTHGYANARGSSGYDFLGMASYSGTMANYLSLF